MIVLSKCEMIRSRFPLHLDTLSNQKYIYCGIVNKFENIAFFKLKATLAAYVDVLLFKWKFGCWWSPVKTFSRSLDSNMELFSWFEYHMADERTNEKFTILMPTIVVCTFIT